MKEYIKVNGKDYPLRFDSWSLMHLERYLKKNVFLVIQDADLVSSTEFLVNLTYSGVFGGLDLDDDEAMPITKKEIARGMTPIDFENVIKVFGEQMKAMQEDSKKKKAEMKVNP